MIQDNRDDMLFFERVRIGHDKATGLEHDHELQTLEEDEVELPDETSELERALEAETGPDAAEAAARPDATAKDAVANPWEDETELRHLRARDFLAIWNGSGLHGAEKLTEARLKEAGITLEAKISLPQFKRAIDKAYL